MLPGPRGACWTLLAALAALGGNPVPTPPTAHAGPMLIDGRRSEASFVVHLRLRMRTEGRISRVSGEMSGDAVHGWNVLVVADGRSLVVKGPRWMDKATRSDQFLAVDSHPEITFRSERISDRMLHAGGRIRGTLTLRGLTRPVSLRLLPSACARPGRDCDLQVNGSINRKDFGMTAHPVGVMDEVELHLRVRLRAPAGGSR